MGNLSRLKCILDHLNDINAMVMIDHFDPITGVIKLSNGSLLNINDLTLIDEIEDYINIATNK